MLLRALQSVNNQTVEPAITYIVSHRTPYGMTPVEHLAWQMNQMLGNIETPWMMRLADDDWLEPDHIEKMWDMIIETLSFFTLYYSYEKDRHIPRVDSSNFEPEDLHSLLLEKNWIDGSGTVVKVNSLIGVGGFKTQIKPFEDWDTWLAMSHYSNFRTCCVPYETWHAGRGNYERIGGIHVS